MQSTDKSSCAAVAAQGFRKPGKFNEQVAMATISSVALDARRTTAKVRFVAPFADTGNHRPTPWQLRLRFVGDRWLVDRLCSLPSAGQDVECLGSAI